MAQLELDLMEYASDALAQAAYVTNGGAGTNPISNNNFETWSSGPTNPPDDWYIYANGATVVREASIIKRDLYSAKCSSLLGTGVLFHPDVSALDSLLTKTVTLGCWVYCNTASRAYLGLADSAGETDSSYHTGDSTWQFLTVTRTLGSTHNSLVGILYLGVSGTTATDAYFDDVIIVEGTVPFNGFNTLGYLQCGSESSIKTQGSYSLKGIASITNSLNKTLTKTLSPVSDLSRVKNLKFDIRASRIGSNIKIGIHDSGGTTTEITPNILTADTFQTVNWDLSAVSDANKDAINQIIITIVNADAANTFYIDFFEIAQAIDVFGIVG